MAVNPYALDFDGSNDYVEVSNDAAFQFGSGDVTFELWINTTDINANLIDKGFNTGNGSRYICLLNSDGTLRFYLGALSGGHDFSGVGTVDDGTWHHLAFVRDGTGAYIYIDGELDASDTATAVSLNNTDRMTFGIRTDLASPGGQAYSGIMDEVRIWNTARTQQQIQDNINRALNGDETGLVGYWKFDEGTGTTAGDSTSNNNDGTISGATWTTTTAPLWNFLEETDSLILALNESDALQRNRSDTDSLVLALLEQSIKDITLHKADTDTLILALLEKHNKFFRDLNSSRFLRIKADATTLEIMKDTTILKIKHDAGSE